MHRQLTFLIKCFYKDINPVTINFICMYQLGIVEQQLENLRLQTNIRFHKKINAQSFLPGLLLW